MIEDQRTVTYIMTKISHAFHLKTLCEPTKQKISIPSKLPIRKNDHKYVASLNSSNPEEIIEVLSFLFKYSTLTETDEKTLKNFSENSLANSLVLDIFATKFIQTSTIPFLLENPNTILALKFAPKKVSKELLSILTILTNMNDTDAYKLGVKFAFNKISNFDLTESLMVHTIEDKSESYVYLKKLHDQYVEKNIQKSLKTLR